MVAGRALLVGRWGTRRGRRTIALVDDIGDFPLAASALQDHYVPSHSLNFLS